MSVLFFQPLSQSPAEPRDCHQIGARTLNDKVHGSALTACRDALVVEPSLVQFLSVFQVGQLKPCFEQMEFEQERLGRHQQSHLRGDQSQGDGSHARVYCTYIQKYVINQ